LFGPAEIALPVKTTLGSRSSVLAVARRKNIVSDAHSAELTEPELVADAIRSVMAN